MHLPSSRSNLWWAAWTWRTCRLRRTPGGPATFPSEQELLRNYLNKDHHFRTKQFDLPRRGIVGDYFGTRNGEAFAASGWRNFAGFFGANNNVNMPDMGTWTPALHTNPYLWAYGCGGGSIGSIGGLGNGGIYNTLLTQDCTRMTSRRSSRCFSGVGWEIGIPKITSCAACWPRRLMVSPAPGRVGRTGICSIWHW